MHQIFISFLGCLVALSGCCCPQRGTAMVDGEANAVDFHFQGLDGASREALAKRAANEQRPITIVALSGGAQNGAFGAGILCNWLDRPAHGDIWTGISTGALLLTHAFLIGDEIKFPAVDLVAEKARYRRELERAYTTYSEPDLMEKRSLLKMISSSAMASMEGLRGVIAEVIPDEVIDRVAAAAAITDVILIGTTNMDSGSFVAWDMKRIAQAKKYDLYRKIVFTSCLVPAAMDPEYIAGEMHADGGVRYQIFVPRIEDELRQLLETPTLRSRAETWRNLPTDTRARSAPPSLFDVRLLVNGRLAEQASETKTCLVDIAMRAVDVLSLESKLGNLLRVQTIVDHLAGLAKLPPGSFPIRLAAIDPTFTNTPASQFDPVYMQALFAHGKQRVLAHDAWRPYRSTGREVQYVP